MIATMATRLVSPITIGRRTELDAALGVLDAAAERSVTHPPITGEAGVGKTRLVGSWSRRRRSAGCASSAGPCAERRGPGAPIRPDRRDPRRGRPRHGARRAPRPRRDVRTPTSPASCPRSIRRRRPATSSASSSGAPPRRAGSACFAACRGRRPSSSSSRTSTGPTPRLARPSDSSSGPADRARGRWR